MVYEAENDLPLLLNILANDISIRNRIRSNTVLKHMSVSNDNWRIIACRQWVPWGAEKLPIVQLFYLPRRSSWVSHCVASHC
jgi:hypothetical protein